jgi:hypothetical protein
LSSACTSSCLFSRNPMRPPVVAAIMRFFSERLLAL